MKRKVVFRADGSPQIGLGHLFRLLAFLEAVHQNFECVFIAKEIPNSLKASFQKLCNQVIEMPKHILLNHESNWMSQNILNKGDVVVIDGYQFDNSYQEKVKQFGCNVIYIDDYLKSDYAADAVVNHTGGLNLPSPNETQYYLGPQYAMLRKPFIEIAKSKTKNKKNDTQDGILICMGGADPNNDTLQVLQTVLNRNVDDRIYLIIGQANNLDIATHLIIDQYQSQIQLLQNLNTEQMIETMRACHTAILPPSTISYEYLCVGGILYIKQIADNQKYNKAYLLNNQLAFDFDDFKIVDDNRIDTILANQKKVFNGQSHNQLINIVKQQLAA